MLHRTTKNYQAKTAEIKEVATILSKHLERYQRGFSSDIKKFIEEAFALQSEYKNYTPERCGKLIAAIESYLALNSLEYDKKITQLLSGFASVTNNDEVASLFAESAAKVLGLIKDTEKRVFLEAEVHFIDEKTVIELLKIEEDLLSLFTRITDKKRFSIARLINLLNPDGPAHKYNVKFIPKSQQINRIESVERYLPQNYTVWRNSKIKHFNNMIKTHKFDDVTKAKLTQTHEAELESAELEYEYILKNMNSLDVRITGYENETLYPSMTFTTKKRAFEKHLRSEVPNALWFEPRPFRTNMTIKEFLDSSQHAYGNVYYCLIGENWREKE